MSVRVIVSVTWDDIGEGRRQHSNRCPVALAVGRAASTVGALRSYRRCEIAGTANLLDDVRRLSMSAILPWRVRQFIWLFDTYWIPRVFFPPMSFSLVFVDRQYPAYVRYG